jgi:putative ribosome biogenesis GTPase RsgA
MLAFFYLNIFILNNVINMSSKPYTDSVYVPKRKPKNPINFQITLNEEQKAAKAKILENVITILTGGAGSGKTSLPDLL